MPLQTHDSGAFPVVEENRFSEGQSLSRCEQGAVVSLTKSGNGPYHVVAIKFPDPVPPDDVASKCNAASKLIVECGAIRHLIEKSRNCNQVRFESRWAICFDNLLMHYMTEYKPAPLYCLDERIYLPLQDEPVPNERESPQASVPSHALTLIIAEITQAELEGSISEFYALNFRAILGMIEESSEEFVNHYLGMAELVASSPFELTIITENRSIYSSLQADSLTAAERCLACIERLCQICDPVAASKR